MEKFIQLGKEFGLEGEKLLEFVCEQEEKEEKHREDEREEKRREEDVKRTAERKNMRNAERKNVRRNVDS